MKAVQNFFHRLLGRPSRPSNAPRVDFSYTIYWTKQVRQWVPARRAAVHDALLPVLARSDFEANAYERRYTVPGLDDQAHSGASLLALRRVLAAFSQEGIVDRNAVNK